MEKAPEPENDQKTVLVVDDDANILNSVSALLVDSNYKVLCAGSGAEALQRSKDYKNEIHLLLSDFQMAGMSGVDLATKMSGERPQLKVLLMSGFTEGMLVLNEGWHFLAKPFIASQLRALIVGLVSPDRSSKFAKPEATPEPEVVNSSN
jgi:DNA-binding NtrC family response regulator